MRMIGFVGASGSGKTTLVTELLPRLRQRGLTASTSKHAHHGFDLDKPGKDSFRHREAGAQEVMLVSRGRWALLHEAPNGADDSADDMALPALARRMAPVDILLVEGFRLARIPKIEVFRPSLGKPPFYPDDPDIVAVASDICLEMEHCLPLNDPDRIIDFMLTQCMAPQ